MKDDLFECYKKKCLEKGIDCGSKEAFQERQSSTFFTLDMLQVSKAEKTNEGAFMNEDKNGSDIVCDEWKNCITCGILKRNDAFRMFKNGTLSRICKVCHGKTIKTARNKLDIPMKSDIEEEPMVEFKKEHVEPLYENKVVIMEMRVFYSAIKMAYDRGVKEGRSFEDLTITEMDLPEMIEHALGVPSFPRETEA